MFTDPEKNLKALELTENMIVADLGAGTGFYSIAAARMVKNGKVYAIEVQPDYVETIRNKIKAEYLKNIEVLWGNVEKNGGTKIRDGIVDASIASNIFFQIEDKDKFILEIKRISKPGASVLVVDWASAESAMAPKGGRVIPKSHMREMFEKKGFAHLRDIDAGAHQYGMIFRK